MKGRSARGQASVDAVTVEVAADEDEFQLRHILAPGVVRPEIDQLVHRLEDEEPVVAAHHGVQLHLVGHVAVDEEGGGDGRRVGKALGLDDDVVELVLMAQQLLHHVDEAADAAVLHLEDLLVGGEHEVGAR